VRRHRFIPALGGVMVAGVAVLSVFATGAALLWVYRADLVTTLTTGILERQGLGPVDLVIDRVGLRGLHARNIVLLDGAIRAAEVTVSYRPLRLLAQHLDDVTIGGLRVLLSEDASGLTLGGNPPGGRSTGASLSGGVRIDALKIDAAEFALDRPGGRLTARISTELALVGADLKNASFTVDVALPFGGVEHPMRIVVPAFTVSAQDDGALKLSLSDAEIVPKDLPWIAQGGAAELVWRTDGAALEVTVARLENRKQPAIVQPLRLTGKASLAGTLLDFSMRAETGASAKARLIMSATGQHDRKSGRGQSSITIGPATFGVKAAQPADFFPALADTLSNVAGTVALSGSVHWSTASFAPDLVLRLTDVAADLPGARFSGVNGDIRFEGLWPPATPPHQILKGIVETGGLPQSAVALDFRLLPSSAFAVDGLTLAFADGRISTTPFTVDLAKPALDTTLRVDQVDLAELFKLIGVDGLSGTGRIDGQIPLRIDDDHVRISRGSLTASGPGVLRLSSDTVPKEIGAAGQPVQLALAALTDFHYESLVLEIDQSAGGEGAILLKLTGNNPAVLDGHPFNFNIKLESNFDRLTEIALRSMAATRELLQRVERLTR